jgi:hypothetical protein
VLVSAVGPGEDPITGGCGCAATGSRAGSPAGALASLSAGALALAAGRRRRVLRRDP